MPRIKPQDTRIWKVLTEEGLSVKDAAQELGVSTARVYAYAQKHNLPKNPEVKPGGGRERQIIEALVAQYPLEVICWRFSMAPAAVARVTEAVRERLGDEKGMDSGGGHQGEATPAVSTVAEDPE